MICIEMRRNAFTNEQMKYDPLGRSSPAGFERA